VAPQGLTIAEEGLFPAIQNLKTCLDIIFSPSRHQSEGQYPG
jgi:hypothetical protein